MGLSGGAPVGLTGAHASPARSRTPATYVWWCNPASGPLRASPSACSSPRTAWHPCGKQRGQRSPAFFISLEEKEKKEKEKIFCLDTDAEKGFAEVGGKKAWVGETLSLETKIKKAFSSWAMARWSWRGNWELGEDEATGEKKLLLPNFFTLGYCWMASRTTVYQEFKGVASTLFTLQCSCSGKTTEGTINQPIKSTKEEWMNESNTCVTICCIQKV